MDPRNLFHTRTTYSLNRLDYLAVLVILSACVLAHARSVRWGAFLAAFAVIDVVGYLPGAISHARAARQGRRVPRLFYVLYNTAHSIAFAALWVGIWALVSGRLEWAMLAVPIHLCGDRGLFGNIYKPFGLAFEPVEHATYRDFAAAFDAAGRS